jgi:hypothetical protein
MVLEDVTVETENGGTSVWEFKVAFPDFSSALELLEFASVRLSLSG